MKRPVLMFALICLSTYGLCQRNQISISMGPALPIGEFGNQQGQNYLAGLAEVGGLLDISIDHALKYTSFGLTASLRARLNGFNSNAALEASDPGYSWTATDKSWATAAVMVGFFHHFVIVKKVVLKEKLSIGCAGAMLPGLSATGIEKGPSFNETNYAVVNSNKVFATGLTGSLQIGASYPLTPRFSLLMNVDFWAVNMVFKNVTQTTATAQGLVISNNYSLSNSQYFTIETQTIDRNQGMNSLNLSAGLTMGL